MTNPTVSETNPSIQVSDSHDFQRALDEAAATMANPAYGNRLRLAKDLVQRGAVTLHDDGTATVISGDHTYDIASACTCDDSRMRSPYCKHVLATQLLSRMTRYLRSGQNGSRTLEDSSATSAPPRSQAWAVREAPASCCLKFKIDGIDIMYTMRDVDDNALFPRVKRVLARLQHKIEPTSSDGPGQDTIDATAERPPGWCTKHDVQMRRFSSETGCWWSHPLDDGTWCKGK